MMRDPIPAGDARELHGDEADHALWEHWGIGEPYHLRRLRMLRELQAELALLEALPISHRPTVPGAFDPIANSRPMPLTVPDLALVDADEGSAAWVLP